MIEYFEKYYRLLIRAASSLAVSVPARRTAVLGMAVHADRLGKAD